METPAEDTPLTPVTMFDSETKSALSEVVALAGAQGEEYEGAANSDSNYQDAEKQALIDEAPVVRLANTILQAAIKENASDIHIESGRHNLRVRFRIDGMLQEVMQMPGYMKQPVTRRYQVLADILLQHPQLAQQGKIGTRFAGKEYVLRVTSVPTPCGPYLVMRIVDASKLKADLTALGFSAEIEAAVNGLLAQRRGLLLIAGGDGQGKTTTQYVLLNRMAYVETSLYAVSDYYDYVHPAVTQVILNPKIGYTAASALRSIASLNAEVVALDGCQDKETLNAALEMTTGSTMVLHTQRGSNAIAALRHLSAKAEAEPYVIAENVCGVLVQTLVRRICSHCKESYEIPASYLWRFGYKVADPNAMVPIARGRGCVMCHHSGYLGRIGLFELLMFDVKIAEMIARRAPWNSIQEAAAANGWKPLREDGLSKVLQGVTTPEEVFRVAGF